MARHWGEGGQRERERGMDGASKHFSLSTTEAEVTAKEENKNDLTSWQVVCFVGPPRSLLLSAISHSFDLTIRLYVARARIEIKMQNDCRLSAVHCSAICFIYLIGWPKRNEKNMKLNDFGRAETEKQIKRISCMRGAGAIWIHFNVFFLNFIYGIEFYFISSL